MSPVPLLPTQEDFRGRVALVTGGTEGLGLHLAQGLAALGCQVFVCGRDRTRGEQAQRQIGPLGTFLPCDLAQVDEARELVADIGRRCGRIDYLVNNAAIDPRIEFAQATAQQFDQIIAVNLRPHFLVSQAALPLLQAGQGKAIVNVSTTNFHLGLSPFVLYNAAKSGIVGLTRSLARELGPLGIRVNALSPGWIMTQRQLSEHASEQDQAELLAAQCVKYLLREEHVTPVTLFLLSSAAAGVTGQEWIVDGGKVHG